MDPKPWRHLSENQLLDKRVTDLQLTIQGTATERFIKRFYQELDAKGLVFHPPCFLANEWFCPYSIPVIGIPFYLAHRKLRALEDKYILEVEGGTQEEFMQLIRHEAGHAYSYAYHLYKKARWRKFFGSVAQEYPDTYRPRPYSRAYVVHLENWYAQSHPDEDFAETFATWLTPGFDWKKRYRGWKALEKLEYVDQLMKQIAGKPAKKQPLFRPKDHDGLRVKLKTYYKRKTKDFEEDYPDFYDRDLNRLFTKNSEERGDLKAFRYLKNNHVRIVKTVSFWTRERKYPIDQLLEGLRHRCKELGLYVRKTDENLDLEIVSFVTTLITNYLFTGKFKRSK